VQDNFPPQLKRKVPPGVYMFLEQRVFWSPFGVLLAIFFLHGPWVGARDLNGYRLLVGAVICPALVSLNYWIVPFNPYQSFAARLAGMTNYGIGDPVIRRAPEIFASTAARRYLLTTSLRISGLLLLTNILIMAAQWRSIDWRPYSPWFFPGILGGCIGSLITIATEYIAWGLRALARDTIAQH